MSIKLNGTEIGSNIKLNGTDLSEIVFNGVSVWQSRILLNTLSAEANYQTYNAQYDGTSWTLGED